MSYLPHSTLWEESEASNAVPLIAHDALPAAAPLSDDEREELSQAEEFRSVSIRLFVFAFVVVGLIAGWVLL